MCQMGENMSANVRVDLLENSAVREAFITFFNARVSTDYNYYSTLNKINRF